eukprot:1074117-Prymnesium_polylepis.1
MLRFCRAEAAPLRTDVPHPGVLAGRRVVVLHRTLVREFVVAMHVLFALSWRILLERCVDSKIAPWMVTRS